MRAVCVVRERFCFFGSASSISDTKCGPVRPGECSTEPRLENKPATNGQTAAALAALTLSRAPRRISFSPAIIINLR